MTITQFNTIMAKLDKFDARLRRVEVSTATFTGALLLAAWALANNHIKIH